jgi:nucleoside-diphosphate-sugar epimerase
LRSARKKANAHVMPRILIFGLGYTAGRIAAALSAKGWEVLSTGTSGTFPFDDAASVALALDGATHVLSSVPPAADGDPVFLRYGEAIRSAAPRWIGYLSSTGVYGDTGGAWVDESAPLHGRRGGRNDADRDWQALGARVFRLPGIYGPDRSALDRVAQGKAHRINLPDQVFSRVHVDDIVSGVLAGLAGPAGVYNLADDHPCSQNDVIKAACDLLARDWPPLLSLDDAGLSAAARAFYAENRRVTNGKARRELGWMPRYPSYREGLRQLFDQQQG